MAPPVVALITDRPRERLYALGSAALTQAELLAILITTGRAGRTSLEVAGDLLAASGTLGGIARRQVAELAQTPGVGAAKAARIAAALELGRRLQEEGRGDRPRIRSPADVFRWFTPRMADLAAEEFHVLALDSQSAVLRDLLITRGILNSSLVHPREVFRGAIAEAAAGIIVAHNHPSGDPTPSADDRAVTRQLVEAGKIIDVPVYDHIIIGNGRYLSFAESGLL
ncbi:MAG TPA: DNA repair protein RadC [Gemmatimonadales bacterium]